MSNFVKGQPGKHVAENKFMSNVATKESLLKQVKATKKSPTGQQISSFGWCYCPSVVRYLVCTFSQCIIGFLGTLAFSHSAKHMLVELISDWIPSVGCLTLSGWAFLWMGRLDLWIYGATKQRGALDLKSWTHFPSMFLFRFKTIPFFAPFSQVLWHHTKLLIGLDQALLVKCVCIYSFNLRTWHVIE